MQEAMNGTPWLKFESKLTSQKIFVEKSSVVQ